MHALRLDEVHAAAATLSDLEGIAGALTGALAGIAPRALHAMTFFAGPASLELDAAAARIGASAVDIDGFAGSYSASAVGWNRWSVAAADRDRFRPVTMNGSPLARYWSRFSVKPEYRRQVVCIGDRAVGLVGSCVVDDHALDEATWSALDACVASTLRALQLAALAAGLANSSPSPAEVVAYLSPEGTVLAAANDADVVTATTAATEIIRARSRRRSFDAAGVRYELRTSADVRSAEINELVATRGIALSARDAALVDWIRRGLTNREVAAMLGVPPTTVKKTLERLFARHGASNRLELLRMLEAG